MRKIHDIVSVILPFIFLFIFFVYPEKMSAYSSTILGKFISVILIIYYTLLHWTYGLFTCLLVIYYYQNYSYQEGFEVDFDRYKLPEIISTDLNPSSVAPVNDPSKNKFKKANCDIKTDRLVHKDMPVPIEMTEHIFPEIKFLGDTCNPCLSSCQYTIR